MATSSFNMVAINLMPVSEKLAQNNHMLWHAQVLAILHGAQLAEFLDGTNKPPAKKIQIKKQSEKVEDIDEVPNPAFELWRAQEQ
jgi:hypothetical protein